MRNAGIGFNGRVPTPRRSLDPGKLEGLRVPAVHLNGPRFWTFEITAHATGGIVSAAGNLAADRDHYQPALDTASTAGRGWPGV
jgi:hypothetical protein